MELTMCLKTLGGTKPIDAVQYLGGGRECSSLKFAVKIPNLAVFNVAVLSTEESYDA